MKKSISILLALLIILAGCGVQQESIMPSQEHSSQPIEQSSKPPEQANPSNTQEIVDEEPVDWTQYMVLVKSGDKTLNFEDNVEVDLIFTGQKKELDERAASYCKNRLKEDPKYMRLADNEDYLKFNFIERTKYDLGSVVMYKVQKGDEQARYIIFVLDYYGDAGWELLDDVLKREKVFSDGSNANSEEVIENLKEEAKKYYKAKFNTKAQYIWVRTNEKNKEVDFWIDEGEDMIWGIIYSYIDGKWEVTNEGY